MITLIVTDAGGHKVARRIENREQLVSCCNSEENQRNWDLYHQTHEDVYKHRLVQVNYNALLADGEPLKGCQTVSNTFFHDIDCRSQQECQAIIGQLLARQQELQLLEVSVSASDGVHVVARRQPGRTILECQVSLSMALHTEMDTQNKECNRVVFHGPINDATTPLLSDALFDEQLSHEEAHAEYLRLKERERNGQEQVPPGAKKANKHYRPWEDTGEAAPAPSPLVPSAPAPSAAAPSALVPSAAVPSASPEAPVPPTAGQRHILASCMAEKGLKDSDLTQEGGRHTTVKIIGMAVSTLVPQAAFQGWLEEKMGSYSHNADITTLVNDIYSKYSDTNRPLNLVQQRWFAQSQRMDDKVSVAAAAEAVSAVYGDTASLSDIYTNPYPPMLPQQLPGCVKAVTSRTPLDQKATVAQAMFPPLCTYPRNLSFLYIDNQYRELRSNCLVAAPTGTGKDTCLKQPLKHLLAPMKARDAENRERLKQFNEEYNSKASTKAKPQRPSDLVIQCVSSNLTAARLAQLMDDAQGAFIYTHLVEFEQWYGVEGKAGSNCTFLNLKLADDEDNPFGQERAGQQSVNYQGPLCLNWNASVTIGRLLQMFRHILIDGPVSRVCMATTPYQPLGAPIPVYGRYDERYDAALKPYIERLMAATGERDCRQARKLMERLKEECDQYISKTQDEVYDNLTHRALVHAFRKACCLYAANGMKWEHAIEGFCRWSLHYDLWLKMRFFGDLIRQADSQPQTSKRGPRNLLQLLPDVFTRQDAAKVRRQVGKGDEGTGNMLSQWLHRGYILQMTDDSFKKAPAE